MLLMNGLILFSFINVKNSIALSILTRAGYHNYICFVDVSDQIFNNKGYISIRQRI